MKMGLFRDFGIIARGAVRAMAMRSQSYEAARKDRLSGGQVNGAATRPRLALLSEAQTLRGRSLQMFRNTPFRAAVNTKVATVIPRPIQVKPDIVFPENQEEADRLNQELLALWTAYSTDAEAFSLDGRTSFNAMQRLVAREMVISGETFIVEHDRKQRRRGMPDVRFEVVTPDALGRYSMMWGNRRAGVEYDQDNRPVSYTFEVDRGGAIYSLETVTVPAARVDHVMVQIYAGQDIGEPEGVAVSGIMTHFGKYYESEVMNAEANARLFGSVESDSPTLPMGGEEVDGEGREIVNFGIGEMLRLLPGEKYNQVAQQRPGAQFSSFVEKTLKLIASICGIPYERLSGDMSGVNFSTARMSGLWSDDMASEFREALRDLFCVRVYHRFARHCIVEGLVMPVAGLAPEEHLRCKCAMPGVRMVDPNKEVQADAMEVEKGFCSWSEVLAKRGRDRDEVIRQIKEDKAAIKAAGIEIDPYGELDGPVHVEDEDDEEVVTAVKQAKEGVA